MGAPRRRRPALIELPDPELDCAVISQACRQNMAGKIFINYRRGDEPGFVQALFGRLEQAFPADQLFMDVDNIPAGEDFVRVLEE